MHAAILFDLTPRDEGAATRIPARIPSMGAAEIRLMEPSQLDEVVGVWVRSRWEALPWLEERMDYSPEQNLAQFRDVIARECDVWVALRQEAVVGLIAISGSKVEQLFVEPRVQGEGIGSALLEQAKTLSPDGLTLFTHQRNERARAFYAARGFRAVRFGISPPPESEPDVEFAWDPGTRASPLT